MRLFHRLYAKLNGYFWLPCPLCGKNFGGHQWRDRNGLSSILPDHPGATRGQGICPKCTRLGFGSRL